MLLDVTGKNLSKLSLRCRQKFIRLEAKVT